MNDKRLVDHKSALNDDPSSGLMFAQWCVGFAQENSLEFKAYIEGIGKCEFPEGAFQADFKPVYEYLQLLKEVAQLITLRELITLSRFPYREKE